MKCGIRSIAACIALQIALVTAAFDEPELFVRPGVGSLRHESSRSRGHAWFLDRRSPRSFAKPRVLRLAVLAPSDRDHQFSLSKILPAITLAARTVEEASAAGRGPLPGWRLQIVDRDSKCSSIHGPLEAFDLYNNKAIGSWLLVPGRGSLARPASAEFRRRARVVREVLKV